MSGGAPRPAQRPGWPRPTPPSRPPSWRARWVWTEAAKLGAVMAAEIKVPPLGESVTTATVARWLKKVGDSVAADEPLVELETDKVTVEVNAPSAGTLGALAAEEGAEVEVGAVLGTVEAGGAASSAKPAAAKPAPAKAAE